MHPQQQPGQAPPWALGPSALLRGNSSPLQSTLSCSLPTTPAAYQTNGAFSSGSFSPLGSPHRVLSYTPGFAPASLTPSAPSATMQVSKKGPTVAQLRLELLKLKAQVLLKKKQAKIASQPVKAPPPAPAPTLLMDLTSVSSLDAELSKKAPAQPQSANHVLHHALSCHANMLERWTSSLGPTPQQPRPGQARANSVDMSAIDIDGSPFQKDSIRSTGQLLDLGPAPSLIERKNSVPLSERSKSTRLRVPSSRQTSLDVAAAKAIAAIEAEREAAEDKESLPPAPAPAQPVMPSSPPGIPDSLTPKVSMEELKRANLKRSTSSRRSYMGMGPMRGNSMSSLLPVPETGRLGIGLSPLGGSGNLGSRVLQHSMTGSSQHSVSAMNAMGALPLGLNSSPQQAPARPAALSRSATFAGRGSVAPMSPSNASLMPGEAQQQHQQLASMQSPLQTALTGAAQGTLPNGMSNLGSPLQPAPPSPLISAAPSGPPALGSLRRMASRRGAYPEFVSQRTTRVSDSGEGLDFHGSGNFSSMVNNPLYGSVGSHGSSGDLEGSERASGPDAFSGVGSSSRRMRHSHTGGMDETPWGGDQPLAAGFAAIAAIKQRQSMSGMQGGLEKPPEVLEANSITISKAGVPKPTAQPNGFTGSNDSTAARAALMRSSTMSMMRSAATSTLAWGRVANAVKQGTLAGAVARTSVSGAADKSGIPVPSAQPASQSSDADEFRRPPGQRMRKFVSYTGDGGDFLSDSPAASSIPTKSFADIVQQLRASQQNQPGSPARAPGLSLPTGFSHTDSIQLSPRHTAPQQQQGVSWDMPDRPSAQRVTLPIFREEDEDEEHQEEEAPSRRSSSSGSSASYQLRDDASSTSDESFERRYGFTKADYIRASMSRARLKIPSTDSDEDEEEGVSDDHVGTSKQAASWQESQGKEVGRATRGDVSRQQKEEVLPTAASSSRRSSSTEGQVAPVSCQDLPMLAQQQGSQTEMDPTTRPASNDAHQDLTTTTQAAVEQLQEDQQLTPVSTQGAQQQAAEPFRDTPKQAAQVAGSASTGDLSQASESSASTSQAGGQTQVKLAEPAVSSTLSLSQSQSASTEDAGGLAQAAATSSSSSSAARDAPMLRQLPSTLGTSTLPEAQLSAQTAPAEVLPVSEAAAAASYVSVAPPATSPQEAAAAATPQAQGDINPVQTSQPTSQLQADASQHAPAVPSKEVSIPIPAAATDGTATPITRATPPANAQPPELPPAADAAAAQAVLEHPAPEPSPPVATTVMSQQPVADNAEPGPGADKSEQAVAGHVDTVSPVESTQPAVIALASPHVSQPQELSPDPAQEELRQPPRALAAAPAHPESSASVVSEVTTQLSPVEALVTEQLQGAAPQNAAHDAAHAAAAGAEASPCDATPAPADDAVGMASAAAPVAVLQEEQEAPHDDSLQAPAVAALPELASSTTDENNVVAPAAQAPRLLAPEYSAEEPAGPVATATCADAQQEPTALQSEGAMCSSVPGQEAAPEAVATTGTQEPSAESSCSSPAVSATMQVPPSARDPAADETSLFHHEVAPAIARQGILLARQSSLYLSQDSNAGSPTARETQPATPLPAPTSSDAVAQTAENAAPPPTSDDIQPGDSREPSPPVMSVTAPAAASLSAGSSTQHTQEADLTTSTTDTPAAGTPMESQFDARSILLGGDVGAPSAALTVNVSRPPETAAAINTHPIPVSVPSPVATPASTAAHNNQHPFSPAPGVQQPVAYPGVYYEQHPLSPGASSQGIFSAYSSHRPPSPAAYPQHPMSPGGESVMAGGYGYQHPLSPENRPPMSPTASSYAWGTRTPSSVATSNRSSIDVAGIQQLLANGVALSERQRRKLRRMMIGSHAVAINAQDLPSSSTDTTL